MELITKAMQRVRAKESHYVVDDMIAWLHNKMVDVIMNHYRIDHESRVLIINMII